MSLLDTASLIVTPNGYKEGKLYSVIPSDGSGDLSVTRATTATRVNSAGLVELVPYNLLQYSNTFSNAAWTKTNTSVTSGQSGYDGSTNAWKLQATATNNCEVDQSFTASETKVFSIYAKAGNVNFVAISVFGAGFGWYNLSNGTLGSSGGTFVSRNIESVGNGWYRCSIVTNVSASGVAVYVADADNSIATTIGSNIFIQDSQLESGSVPTTYQKTETRLNIPRLDYSNGTCPSLLVEPQRTNLLTYSSSFDDSSWVKSSTTISANTTTSPSGIQDAETSVFNTSGQLYKVVSTTAICTLSIYVKKGTNRYFSIQLETNSLAYRAIYDLDTASVTFTGANTTATIEDAGSGWYRVTATNTTSDAIAYTTFQAAASGTSVGGSGTFYLWGAQLEAGSYSTSYIPTTSANVTRNADVISKTGISSLIGQTEGTLFVEEIYDSNAKNNGGLDDTLISLTDGTSNNLISIFHYGPSIGNIVLFIRLSNTTQAVISTSASTSGTYKIALAYKNNDVVGYVNGVQVGTDTSASIPATSAVVLYDPVTTNSATKTTKYKAAALWKTRLTNDQLATLTTL